MRFIFIFLMVVMLSSTSNAFEKTFRESITPDDNVKISISIKPAEQTLYKEVTLTYHNKTAKIKSIKPPVYVDENNREPVFPMLILLFRKGTSEESFMLSVSEKSSQEKTGIVELKPNETYDFIYSLDDFWRWGTSGTDKWGALSKYITAGDNNVKVKAIILTKEDVSLESQEIDLKCSYQEWLFKSE